MINSNTALYRLFQHLTQGTAGRQMLQRGGCKPTSVLAQANNTALLNEDLDPDKACDHVALAKIGCPFLREGLANRIMCDGTQGLKITNTKFDSETVVIN